MSEVKSISVTQLARRMRNVLEIQVGEVWVEGEVSNLRKQSSGHWYFSLKDEGAQLSCAMFSAKRREGAEVLDDGAQVKIFAEVSFYEARGQAQMIVQKAQAAGQGGLQAKFEALKEKLNKEGLFDAEKKKKMPVFPRVLGLVTSPTGAALQDILNVLGRRAPWLKVVLFPAQVQGKGAEKGIAEAIRRAGRAGEEGLPQPEIIIVGRGGGSLEDLWNFNEEIVARAIAECAFPIISAVGHEIDFTIADFVADLRAPTPSAAAELAVPDQGELRSQIQTLRTRLLRAGLRKIEREGDRLHFLQNGILGQSSERILREYYLRLEDLRQQNQAQNRDQLSILQNKLSEKKAAWAHYHPRQFVNRWEERLGVQADRLRYFSLDGLQHFSAQLKQQEQLLRTLGPQKVLERGYSITTNARGELITDPKQVKPGDLLKHLTQGGEIASKVEKKNT